MCSGYSGPGGTGIQAYIGDVAKKRGWVKSTPGSGVNSGGSSGPSAAAAAGAAYMRRKAGAPLLDSIFGVDNNG